MVQSVLQLHIDRSNDDGIHFPVSLRFFHHFTFSSLVFISSDGFYFFCRFFFFCSCYNRVNYLLSLCCVAFFHFFLSFGQCVNFGALWIFWYNFFHSIHFIVSSLSSVLAAERKTFYFLCSSHEIAPLYLLVLRLLRLGAGHYHAWWLCIGAMSSLFWI